VPAQNATQSELVSVHTAQHVQNICNLASKSQGDLNDMASDLNSAPTGSDQSNEVKEGRGKRGWKERFRLIKDSHLPHERGKET